MSRFLLIFGASIRAAADSARRAGYTISGGDLFADADLAAHCQVQRAIHYPADLACIAEKSPPEQPWLYTGALENYPQLVEQVSKGRSLYGNRGETLRRVRDPRQLAAALAAADVPSPKLAEANEDLPRDGSWLVKRAKASGGGHVVPLDASWDAAAAGKDVHFQQRIDGAPCSAVYVAAKGDARLLGVSRQILGAPWCGARGYQYAGSIGPLSLPPVVKEQLRRIGEALASSFRLQGLFGVDFVLQGEQVWPIEVNPRYTASIEILERGSDLKSIELHVSACRDGRLPREEPTRKGPVFAKAILFAQQALVVSKQLSNQALAASQRPWPEVADIPQPGANIEPGRPVLTVFTSGEDEQQALEHLQQQVARWRGIIPLPPGEVR